jgi:hypothetical protein
MRSVILQRSSLAEEAEVRAMFAVFGADRVLSSRTQVRPGDLVIGRYSVLPYYEELDADVRLSGGALINNLAQHRYIADISQWSRDLEGLTPPAIDRFETLLEDQAYVVKGETNSRKGRWRTHMFAQGKAEAIAVRSRLVEDGLLQDQTIYARPYVPLRSFGEGIGGIPISHEYRFFVCDGEILTGGFYWAEHVGDLLDRGLLPVLPGRGPVLDEVIARIGDKARFYVVDVAEKAEGGWMVVELNDGQMSGLSCCDPVTLYTELDARLNRRFFERKCDACPAQAAYTCGCSRCAREEDDEKFHACAAHAEEVRENHWRVREREAQWMPRRTRA